MSFLSGDATFLVATAYFTAFVAIHLAVVIYGRRLDGTAPKDTDRRVRLARILGFLQAAKAAWFAVLFTVAAITVVAATPKLPLLEVIIVYGGMGGVIFSLMQAVEWFNTAHRVRRAQLTLQSLALRDGMVVVTDMVTVRMPEEMRTRLISGEPLTVEDTVTLRNANPKETVG